MTTRKQIQMTMRNMLFITWAVNPEMLRKLVDERLELDTISDSARQAVALVSAVCFSVADVRASVLPLPTLNFEQVNYRAYVRANGIPAVCFLDMQVNSRMVTAVTSFLRAPVQYEDIDIKTASGGAGLLRYTIASAGLRAEAIIGEDKNGLFADCEIAPSFITQRLVGFGGTGDGMFKIEIELPGLDAVSARVENVEAPRLEQLGVLTSGQSTPAHSALYVREAAFQADMPVRVG